MKNSRRERSKKAIELADIGANGIRIEWNWHCNQYDYYCSELL